MKSLITLTGLALLAITFHSCKKKPVQMATPCPTTIMGFGFSTPIGSGSGVGPYAVHSFGTLNTSSATGTVLGSVNAYSFSKQGAYSPADNCYYTFTDSAYHPILCKISMTGSVTYLSSPTLSYRYFEALTYDAFHNKLLALKGGTTSDTLVEIIPGSGTFSYTVMCNTVGRNNWSSPATMAINSSTGDLYYVLNDISSTPLQFSVQKIASGTATATVIAADTGKLILGLEYSNGGNCLYAVRETTPAYIFDFVKIGTTGSMSVLAAGLPIVVNNEYYSTCIDDCNSKYIINSQKHGLSFDSSLLLQLNLSGTVLQTNTIYGVYQGMDVKY